MQERIKVSMCPFGTFEVTGRGIEANGLIHRQAIPFTRITAVTVNRLLNSIEIETGADVHRFALWDYKRMAELRNTIEDRIQR